MRYFSQTNKTGSNLKNLSEASEHIGFKGLGVKLSYDALKNQVDFPCIAHWNENHFVVIYQIKKDTVYISDPAIGLVNYTKDEFLTCWLGRGSKKKEQGILLLLEPTPKFYNQEDDSDEKLSFKYIYHYLFKYKKLLVQLMLGLLFGSLLQVAFPFLTQSIVDVGIQNQDINFIYLVLFAQLGLFIGRTSIDFFRGWILLHLTTRINISMISDFFVKMMKLPISYFDVRKTGDILQRINDHKRLETLLTSSSLSMVFSILNFFIFGAILAYYSLEIFITFLIGSAIYVTWVVLFLKRRKTIDYKRFTQLGKLQSKVIEIIGGMQEIKLFNAEHQKRWGWEMVQAKLFKVKISGLMLNQTQSIGSGFINEFKNMFIVVLSAKLVIDGDLTLGMMISVTYIIGQLNSPINQFISMIHMFQDANIALERLSEIYNQENEEDPDKINYVTSLPKAADINLEKVSFKYPGSSSYVLKDLTVSIPSGKVTAIVGSSGSGKTTLMKLLLQIYKPDDGKIFANNILFNSISPKAWRNYCGVVMQEGFIFNDTIAHNIALGEDKLDINRLDLACEIANIKDFVDDLPQGYNTEIGMEGMGLSTGQKQRLLIARAVYKDPKFILFDEATSALDSENERIIMDNLSEFYKNKTVVVIAHRLSTVIKADQILVVDKGQIIEQGNHNELLNLKGVYFNLVGNQLALEKVNGINHTNGESHSNMLVNLNSGE